MQLECLHSTSVPHHAPPALNPPVTAPTPLLQVPQVVQQVGAGGTAMTAPLQPPELPRPETSPAPEAIFAPVPSLEHGYHGITPTPCMEQASAA